jgi:homoserine O-acetyltransferase
MAERDPFASSDSVRSAAPLRFARTERFAEPLALEHGGSLPSVDVAYETYGVLDASRSNAVLVCHALTGDSHVARHGDDDTPGWWEAVVGPGKPIDTERWFLICPNLLGGCRGSTGPASANPATGRAWGADFPVVTVSDMVECQRRLLDRLGIERLHAVVGGSLGGHVALCWAQARPDRVAAAIGLGTSARLSSQALSFDVVGRNAIRAAPGGAGLALARMLGHITYLSPQSMAERFDATRTQARQVESEFERRFAVGAYLAHQGGRFVERFEAQSYVALSLAMDLFDLGGSAGEIARSLARARSRFLLASFSSDWLFSPEQSRDLVQALAANRARVSYCNVTSRAGHDAFLLEDDVAVYGELIRGFLESATTRAPAIGADPALELVPAGASIVEVGCGDGARLAALHARGHHDLLGIDPDERAVVACVGRGLDALHADAARGLALLPDRRFDVALLSESLQTSGNLVWLLDELLRVGRSAVVRFANAAWHEHRQRLSKEGRAPEGWHVGPPQRAFSIADFQDLCRARAIRIERLVGLDSASGRVVVEDPNRMADQALCRIARG